MKKAAPLLLAFLLATLLQAEPPALTYQLNTDLSYTTLEDSYAQERCKLDGYYPENAEETDATLYELDGYGHDIIEPAHPLALKFIQRILAKN